MLITENLVYISIRIDFENPIFLKNSDLLYNLYEFYMIEKHDCIQFSIFNWIYFVTYSILKSDLSHSYIAKSGKIIIYFYFY